MVRSLQNGTALDHMCAHVRVSLQVEGFWKQVEGYLLSEIIPKAAIPNKPFSNFEVVPSQGKIIVP